MKLLLRRDIPKVGLAGDVVEVKEGYARNYLIPQHMGVEPTKANMKRIEEDKRLAEEERKRVRAALEAEAGKHLFKPGENSLVLVNTLSSCIPVRLNCHLYGAVTKLSTMRENRFQCRRKTDNRSPLWISHHVVHAC